MTGAVKDAFVALVEPAGDMDGDGWVARAFVKTPPIGARVITLQIDSGQHVTALDIRADEIAEFRRLLKRADKALRAAL